MGIIKYIYEDFIKSVLGPKKKEKKGGRRTRKKARIWEEGEQF